MLLCILAVQSACSGQAPAYLSGVAEHAGGGRVVYKSGGGAMHEGSDMVMHRRSDVTPFLDSTAAPADSQKRFIYYFFLSGGAVPGNWLLSESFGFRLFNIGGNVGLVESEEIPAYRTDVAPEDAGAGTRYRQGMWGGDLSYFRELTGTLWVRAGFGYYRNRYVDLTHSASTNSYYRAGTGSEWRFAFGASLFADIEADWPVRGWRYLVGLDLHAQRGIGLFLGWGERK